MLLPSHKYVLWNLAAWYSLAAASARLHKAHTHIESKQTIIAKYIHRAKKKQQEPNSNSICVWIKSIYGSLIRFIKWWKSLNCSFCMLPLTRASDFVASWYNFFYEQRCIWCETLWKNCCEQWNLCISSDFLCYLPVSGFFFSAKVLSCTKNRTIHKNPKRCELYFIDVLYCMNHGVRKIYRWTQKQLLKVLKYFWCF